EPELLAALRSRVGSGVRLPGVGDRKRFAIAALLAVVTLCTGIYLAIPGFSRAVARRVPLEYERELGAQLLPFLSSEYCSKPDADAALEALKRRLDPEGEIPVELHVWRSDMVNAFALPGGIVIISEA